MKKEATHTSVFGIFKISFMLAALLFLTVMANQPIPEIPWFALSEVNEINEIHEKQVAVWPGLGLNSGFADTSLLFSNLHKRTLVKEFMLPLSWVEMVQTPPPEHSGC